ncbi:uncharacterized protein LOC131955766 isoform X2 [Physella acuta]|uniref:uncharacterized protein LOC131955766 isoform X2 n=1 Tax=Physella acuta TaxID=109671 RepID=UPI0027DCDD7A|nr:uncharacterized protein LOC131955766 isoform X2 [Physella acuta]
MADNTCRGSDQSRDSRRCDEMHPPTWLLVLLVLWTTWMHTGAGLLLAQISACVSTEDFTFARDSPVCLRCHLLSSECSTTSATDVITLLPQDVKLNDTHVDVNRTDNCSVVVTVNEFPTARSNWLFECRKNGTSLVNQNVILVDRPAPPDVRYVFVAPTLDLLVVIEREPHKDYTDVLMVEMVGRGGHVTHLCQMTCSTRLCYCMTSGQAELVNVADVTIRLELFRPSLSRRVYHLETNRTLNLTVVPSRVVNLTLTDVSDSEATVTFGVDKDTDKLVETLAGYGVPLTYRIVLENMSDRGKSVQLKITKTHPGTLTVVRLQHLTAFTDYRVVVTGVAAGGGGMTSTLHFTTSKAVPASPPKLDVFNHMWMWSNHSRQGQVSLWILWQPLPQSAIGGSNISYVISFNNEAPITTNNSHVRKVFEHLPNKPLTFRIWSANEIGKSLNFTEITLHTTKGASPARMVVNYLDTQTMVAHLRLRGQRNLTKVAILWCNRGGFRGLLCSDYTRTSITETKRTNLDTNFLVNVSRNESSGVYKGQNPVYVDWQEIDVNNQGVIAPVSNSARVESVTEEDVFDCAQYVEASCLHTWTRLCLCMFLGGQSEVTDLRQVNMAPSSRTDSSSVRTGTSNLNVFFSLLVDGRWTGMIPSECYFTSYPAVHRAILNITQHVENSRHVFKIKQECETSNPTQFLAEYFTVYSTTDMHCRVTKVMTQKVIHDVFAVADVEVEVPGDVPYVCVRAVGSSEKVQSDVKVIHVDGYKDDLNNDRTNKSVIIVSAVSITVLLLIAAPVLWFARRFQKRGQFYKVLATQSRKITAVSRDVKKHQQPDKSKDGDQWSAYYRDSTLCILPLQNVDAPHQICQDSSRFCTTGSNDSTKPDIKDPMVPHNSVLTNSLTEGSNVEALSEFGGVGHKKAQKISGQEFSDLNNDTEASHQLDMQGPVTTNCATLGSDTDTWVTPTPVTANCYSSDGVYQSTSGCLNSLESSGQSSYLLDLYAENGLTCRYHDDSEGDESSV